MRSHGVFWKLEAFSDGQLLERLGLVLGSSRRLVAELVAHLGEVEERRLHLAAACSSMFAYCLKLGMTEDEAYRRIEVARLARRYPAIFPLLANGQLSLSVVALLKHHLSEENHLELLAAATGKSVAQTRELIAARFPRPDVPSSVRKLPERRTMTEPSLAPSTPPGSSTGGMAPSSGVTVPSSGVTEPRTSQTEPRFTANVTSSAEVPHCAAPTDVAKQGGSMSFAPAVDATRATAPETSAPPLESQRAASPPQLSRIEPLSAQRYKVQFTASAELARKLALARDLMRHSQPGGELGPIVERALDLLIESLMQRRFGKKACSKRTSAGARSADPEARSEVVSDGSATRGAAEPSTALTDASPHQSPSHQSPSHQSPSHQSPSHQSPSHQSPSRDTADPNTTAPPAPGSPEPALPEPALPESALPESAPPAVVTPESPPPESVDVQVERRGELERAPVSPYVPRSTRRAVVERDGLGCSWVDEHGGRCGSRAWLEYDHRHPRAKGGGSEPNNVRLLCRGHNRFAAERAYGRKHVERTIAERQRDERCT